MSETAHAEAIGSPDAGKVTRYLVIGGVLLLFAISSALVVFDWLSNSLSVVNLVLSVLNVPVAVVVAVLNLVSPLSLGSPSLILPPEAQVYIAALAGFYSLVFLLVAVLGSAGSPRDYFGGAALVGVAIFAFIAARDLSGMRGFAFGPGTAPRLFSYALGALGIAVAATGLLTKGPAIDRFYFRGPFFVTLSVVLFAWLVRPLGLVIATFLSIVAAAGATPEARLFETLLWAAFLTLFCCLLFPYALNLPMQMWPNSWDLVTILKGLSSIR